MQILSVIKSFPAKIKGLFFRLITSFKKLIVKFPVRVFAGLMVTILLLIIVGNYLRQPPKTASEKTPAVKTVQFFSIGTAPTMQFQAKIEKSGIIKVFAQSPGIAQQVYVKEGEHVSRGKTLAWLSTTPAGGTVPSVQRQLAQKNYQFILDNYPAQKEIIDKQRELAQKVDGQSDALRDITSKSLGETRDLINLDQDIVNTLNTQLTTLINTNVGGTNDALILQTKQSIAGVTAGLNTLKSALRNSEYSSDENKEPAQISNLTKDAALKQLDLQDKTLQLNQEIGKLNLRIAQISEYLMSPSSPCPGVVERVYIKVGQNVKPGDLLFTITAAKTSSTAVVFVSGDIARSISRVEKSTLFIGNETIKVAPRYISSQPTEGTLHSIMFDVPEEYNQKLSDASSLRIEIPIGAAGATSVVPFVPLDSVYQTEIDSYVYTATESASGLIAQSKSVTLGNVFGDYVEVQRGLEAKDQVIVDRNVVSGDLVNNQPQGR